MTDVLTKAMTWLGEQPDTIFLGQGVEFPGTKMSKSLEGVPKNRLCEMPVAENLQLGISIGLSLEGFVPISMFPRANFLLCAMDQLVLHLDKLPLYSDYRPRVIIRTAVGTKYPLDAGPQHTGSYSGALREMLETVLVCRLYSPNSADALEAYQKAYHRSQSTIIVE